MCTRSSPVRPSSRWVWPESLSSGTKRAIDERLPHGRGPLEEPFSQPLPAAPGIDLVDCDGDQVRRVQDKSARLGEEVKQNLEHHRVLSVSS